TPRFGTRRARHTARCDRRGRRKVGRGPSLPDGAATAGKPRTRPQHLGGAEPEPFRRSRLTIASGPAHLPYSALMLALPRAPLLAKKPTIAPEAAPSIAGCASGIA